MDKEMIDSVILVIAALTGGVTLTAMINDWGKERKFSLLNLMNLLFSVLLMLIVLYNVTINVQFIGF